MVDVSYHLISCVKSGMKFSAEEERMVIELQGQFGNKWARIASCLPGRTDNDVKNFWSSRQKRLTRILRTPSTPRSSSSKLRNTNAVDVLQSNVPTLIEVRKGIITPTFTSLRLFLRYFYNSECDPSPVGLGIRPISGCGSSISTSRITEEVGPSC